MAYVLGSDIKAGQRFKMDGRWYDATGDAGPFEGAGGPAEGLRTVPVTPGTGFYSGDTVGVLTEIAYQLPGGGVPVTVYIGGGTSYWEVDFTRNDRGDRWYVRLHGGKALLGWLTAYAGEGGGWCAHVATEAFQVHPYDTVPGYLVRRYSGSGHAPLASGNTRAEAASELLYWLHQKHAPALGFGPHYDVDAYDDPWCPGSEQRWADDGDGRPVCPACGTAPALDRLSDDRRWPPRRRGPGKWDGKVSQHLNTEARTAARR